MEQNIRVVFIKKNPLLKNIYQVNLGEVSIRKQFSAKDFKNSTPIMRGAATFTLNYL